MKTLLFALSLGLSFVLHVPSAEAVSNDSMTVGIAAEFENLNPIIGQQGATRYMLYLAWRPLVVLDLDGKWQPMMIKTIPTIENKMAKHKGEGLETTFELIDGAKWGDGTPMSCADIELGWKVGLSKNVSNPNREPSENISGVTWDPKAPKKCTVTFIKTNFDYYNNYPYPLPSHIEGPIFEKFKEKEGGYEQNSAYTKNPSNPGLYDGPYMISEVKLGSHLTFVPNPNFHGQKPSIRRIIMKLVPNNATMEANIRSGNIDMISSPAGFSVDQAVDFEKKIAAEHLPYKVIFEDGLLYAHIDVNLDNPILSDLKVRKALSHAFNKKDIIDSFLYGRGKPALHLYTEKDPWYTDKVSSYKYSKRDAAKLLDEAGWKMGSNGVREKNGKKLSLTVIGASGSSLNEKIEAYLQSQFKAVGIELVIKNEPPRVFFGETVKARRFDLALFSWMSIPENSPRSVLHSSMIPDKNGGGGQNFTGYKNAEVDKMIDSLEHELDAKKRAELGRKIAVAYTRDIPVIPVYYRPNSTVIPAALKNFRLSGHLYYETLYAENWSL